MAIFGWLPTPALLTLKVASEMLWYFMKQIIAQTPCLQSLFLHFLCFEMVMVRSDWGCLDYTGLPRSIQPASLWAILDDFNVCCRPGCLTVFGWRLQAAIFEDSLSLSFWFYCSLLFIYWPSPHSFNIYKKLYTLCPSTSPDLFLCSLYLLLGTLRFNAGFAYFSLT